MEHSKLILKLHEIGAVKFGEFKLKSGVISPIYIDLRVIIAYPSVLQEVSKLLYDVAKSSGSHQCDQVCGVPYTALPIATVISIDNDIPMVIRRKEAKDYGTKKMLEGVFEEGQNCLIIEDVVTTGSSVRETAKLLREHGMVVTDAVVLLNRDQGGAHELTKHGIKLASAFTLPQVLDVLLQEGKIDIATVAEAKSFLQAHSTDPAAACGSTTAVNKANNLTLDAGAQSMFNKDFKPKMISKAYGKKPRIHSYGERASRCKNPIGAKLLSIMESKKTNLCLSADVDSIQELIEIAKSVGQFICCIKTHVDTLEHWNDDAMKCLRQVAEQQNFLVFEDRKFADIGSTVKSQLTGGAYRISEWADIVNAHSLPGPGVLQGLKAGAERTQSKLACLLIAEMSPKGNLLSEQYTKDTVQMAEDFGEFVIGFISTSRVSNNPGHIHLSPGVKLQPGTDSLGQRYLTPQEIIHNRGSDVIIVGRGITESANRITTARAFRDAGWAAYVARS